MPTSKRQPLEKQGGNVAKFSSTATNGSPPTPIGSVQKTWHFENKVTYTGFFLYGIIYVSKRDPQIQGFWGHLCSIFSTLGYDSHTHFKCAVQWCLMKLPIYAAITIFRFWNISVFRSFVPIDGQSHSYPQPQTNTNLLSFPIDLSFLGISYKHNHATRSFLCLAFFLT